MSFNYSTVLLSLLLITAASCKKKDDNVPAPADDHSSLKTSIVTNYANIVHSSYTDSYSKALELKAKINILVSTPSATALTEARAAWIDARVPYLQTEAYRFYGGPIDGDNGPEGLLNAWPMDEVYIDYVFSDLDNPSYSAITNDGIINDATKYPTIDKAVIAGLNEGGGETNISCGYHAIEFLLWGQDVYADSPGKRPYTDYVVGAGATAANQARRGQYLNAIADLLVDDLKQLVDAWAPGTTNYRTTFISTPDASLKNMLLGMGSLAGGELSGERMQVAYNSQLQEDEHSCFSDNTTNDIIYDAKGIQNVYYGRYTPTAGTPIDGIGIDSLVSIMNSTRNTEMKSRLTLSQTAVEAIHAPFDQEILDSNPAGRTRILTAIESLMAEADKIVEVAASIGLTLSL